MTLEILLLTQSAPPTSPAALSMEIRDWLSLASLLISIIALYISARMAIRTHDRGIYDAVESAGNELLNVQLQYPQFRDKAYCDALLDKPATDVDRLRLEAYIIKSYNTLETLYEKFGERRLAKSSFLPAMKAIAQRHRKWLYVDDHVDAYQRKMVNFLEANKN
jgi:hypothetical protein